MSPIPARDLHRINARAIIVFALWGLCMCGMSHAGMLRGF